MKEATPIPCPHLEVTAVRSMDPHRLGYVHRCRSCHEVVTVKKAAA